jgi:hypothetical protein
MTTNTGRKHKTQAQDIRHGFPSLIFQAAPNVTSQRPNAIAGSTIDNRAKMNRMANDAKGSTDATNAAAPLCVASPGTGSSR